MVNRVQTSAQNVVSVTLGAIKPQPEMEPGLTGITVVKILGIPGMVKNV